METTSIDNTEKFSRGTFLKKIPGEHSWGTFLRNVSTLLRHTSKTHSSVMFRNDIPKRYSTKNSIETLYSLEIFLRIIPSHHDSFIMRRQNRTEQNKNLPISNDVWSHQLQTVLSIFKNQSTIEVFHGILQIFFLLKRNFLLHSSW